LALAKKTPAQFSMLVWIPMTYLPATCGFDVKNQPAMVLAPLMWH
jgi:hypothetical protein